MQPRNVNAMETSVAEPVVRSSQSRRTFIHTSAALLALPWLESLAPADEAAPPRRMVSICTAFGLYGPAFFPSTAGTDYEPSEYTALLDELRQHYTVFSGISHPEIGGDHASEACFLTSAKHPNSGNFRNSVSLDYVAAKHVGNATRFPLLSLRTLEGGGALTHTESGAAVPALDRPSQVFAKMFLAGKPNEVENELARLRRGQSILDRMADRFAALEPKLSQADRQQISDYTQAVREMEQQLHADEAWVVRPKPVVDEPPPSDNLDRSDIVGRTQTMCKLIRLALQTDSTRVVSLFIKGVETTPPIDGVTESHHGLTHHGRDPGKIAQLKIIEKAEVQVLREFLLSLLNTPDGSGSLLDHTQVLIGSNLGDASGHGTTNLPILLAGGGYQHGRHIAGDTRNNTPLGKLFVSMLRRFGVETDRFGSGQGTIEGLV